MESADESNVLLAIVQSQDADIAEQALKKIGIDSYQLPSVGGFLGRKNITLVIESPSGKNDAIIELLKSSCSQRIEFIAVPIENAQLAIPTPTQVAVGGAAVFGLTAEKIIKI